MDLGCAGSTVAHRPARCVGREDPAQGGQHYAHDECRAPRGLSSHHAGSPLLPWESLLKSSMLGRALCTLSPVLVSTLCESQEGKQSVFGSYHPARVFKLKPVLSPPPPEPRPPITRHTRQAVSPGVPRYTPERDRKRNSPKPFTVPTLPTQPFAQNPRSRVHFLRKTHG